MSKETITFRSILLSFLSDSNGQYGYNVDERTGMYRDYNEVVDETIDKFFSTIRLPEMIKLDDEFKRAFAFEFQNASIEHETFAQFRDKLQSVLTSDCYNYLRLYNEIRNKDVMDMINNMDMTNIGEAEQESSSLGINAQPPEEKLSIIYDSTGKDRTITMADLLQESHGKGGGKSKTNTSGYSGVPIFILLNRFAEIPDIQRKMFNIIRRKCFSKMW